MATLDPLRRSTAAAVCLECGKCSTLCPLVRHEPAAFGPFSASRLAVLALSKSTRPKTAMTFPCSLMGIRCTK